MRSGTLPRRLRPRRKPPPAGEGASACTRGCALRQAARQGDGDQQPRGGATCGCLLRRALSLAMHIPACTLAPTLSPALNSCPSVCRQHTGNTRARGRSSAAEGSRVAEGIGHSAGEQQGVLFEGEFQWFSEGGVQSIRSPMMLPKSPGQQTSGQAVLLDTSGSGRRHRQTLSERLTAHLQTLSDRPAVSCPGPVCVAQFVVLRACVTV